METDSLKTTTKSGLREKPDSDIEPAAEVGWYLQRERETLGHSLMDVARELRVEAKFLHALEQGELHHQLGWTYVLSYIRSYSDFLGFEPGPVVRHYKKILADETSNRSCSDSDDLWPFSEVRARAAIATFAGVVGLMGLAGLVFEAEKATAENADKGAHAKKTSELFERSKAQSLRHLKPSLQVHPVRTDAQKNIQGSREKTKTLSNSRPRDRNIPEVAVREVPLPDNDVHVRKSRAAVKRLEELSHARLAAVSEN